MSDKPRYTYQYVKPSARPPFVKTVRYTNGRFVGWSQPMGIASVPYAIFATRTTEILIPRYDLTPETLARIGQPEKEGEQ